MILLPIYLFNEAERNSKLLLVQGTRPARKGFVIPPKREEKGRGKKGKKARTGITRSLEKPWRDFYNPDPRKTGQARLVMSHGRSTPRGGDKPDNVNRSAKGP